ncbi:magnesium transporter [Methylotuvimicrobium sp.]|uniref:magnesium transporter n=1 Tax=Methylotuvimicrobium sp. TaxID=2822413 RepID=UPI003D64CB83
MTHPIIESFLRHSIERKDYQVVRQFLEEFQPADLCDLIQQESLPTALDILKFLSYERRARVFGYLPNTLQEQLAAEMSDDDVSLLLKHMDADEGADLLNLLPEERHDGVLRSIARKEREDLRRLASHSEGTAGAIMTSDYAAIPAHVKVSEALNIVRTTAPGAETIYQIFVTDGQHQLLGTVSLRELILAPQTAKIQDIMMTDIVTVSVDAAQEDAAKIISRYDLLALPVIDSESRLVGIITYDDAMDVAEAEATEDMHKSATIGNLEGNFRDARLLTLYRKRIVWLILLVFGNLFSGAGIAFFEDMIAAYVVLVFFLPVLVGSGGNAGSQAATLVIRGLATGDVDLKDWGRLLGRELVIASGLGLTMAMAISMVGHFRGGDEIALVVGLSMVSIVIVGSLVGMCLPFILNRLGWDPATASAPLVTTIADSAGVLIYFSIATAILGLPV